MGVEENESTPKMIDLKLSSDTSITQVSCGGHHTIFLDNDGWIYVTGRNYQG